MLVVSNSDVIGNYFGPKYSKFLPEVWLRRGAGAALLFACAILMRQ